MYTIQRLGELITCGRVTSRYTRLQSLCVRCRWPVESVSVDAFKFVKSAHIIWVIDRNRWLDPIRMDVTRRPRLTGSIHPPTATHPLLCTRAGVELPVLFQICRLSRNRCNGSDNNTWSDEMRHSRVTVSLHARFIIVKIRTCAMAYYIVMRPWMPRDVTAGTRGDG